MADENESQVTRVDLDSLDEGLVQEVVEINPDVNPMEAPPPVADGTWRVKLTYKNEWEHKETKPNKSTGEKREYLATQFSGIVIDEGGKENNKRVFGRVNTLVFDGKNEMTYILLQVYGGKANPDAREKVAKLNNYVKIAKAFNDALVGEPIIRVSTKWIARYNAGDKENGDWKTALTGMTSFPPDGAGGRRAFTVVKGHGEVPAQAVIQDYFPDVV